MLRDFNARIRQVAIAVVAAAVCIVPLSSCGVKGPLKLPPPPAAAGVAADAASAGASADVQPAPATETPAVSAPKPPEARP